MKKLNSVVWFITLSIVTARSGYAAYGRGNIQLQMQIRYETCFFKGVAFEKKKVDLGTFSNTQIIKSSTQSVTVPLTIDCNLSMLMYNSISVEFIGNHFRDGYLILSEKKNSKNILLAELKLSNGNLLKFNHKYDMNTAQFKRQGSGTYLKFGYDASLYARLVKNGTSGRVSPGEYNGRLNVQIIYN